MSVHRLRELLDTTPETINAVEPSAFVPCPLPVLHAYSPAQLQQVQDIYRLARERAEAAHSSRQRVVPQFSVN